MLFKTYKLWYSPYWEKIYINSTNLDLKSGPKV